MEEKSLKNGAKNAKDNGIKINEVGKFGEPFKSWCQQLCRHVDAIASVLVAFVNSFGGVCDRIGIIVRVLCLGIIAVREGC